jgi:hypothetical protein
MVLGGGLAQAAPPPVTVDVPGAEPKVTVMLDQPGATLARVNIFGVGSVCQAPCVARVPRDGVYKVDVAGSKTSDELDFRNSPASVRLKLTPPSTGGMLGGSILTYLGVSLIPSGLVMMAVGAMIPDADISQNYVVAGAIVTGVGGLSLGIGLPILLSNRYTEVEQQPLARGLSFSYRF